MDMTKNGGGRTDASRARRFRYLAYAVLIGAALYSYYADDFREKSRPPESSPEREAFARLNARRMGGQSSGPDADYYRELIVMFRDSGDPLIRRAVNDAMYELMQPRKKDVGDERFYDEYLARLSESEKSEWRNRVIWVKTQRALAAGEKDRVPMLRAVLLEERDSDPDYVKRQYLQTRGMLAGAVADIGEKKELFTSIAGDALKGLGRGDDRFLHEHRAWALSELAKLSKDPEDKRRYFNRIIAEYGFNDDGYLGRIAAWAANGKAMATDDDQVKRAAYEFVRERYASSEDESIVKEYLNAVSGLALLCRDPGERRRLYDGEIAAADQANRTGALPRLLEWRARAAGGAEERRAYYGRILEEFSGAKDERTRDIVAGARLGMARAAEDSDAAIAELEAIFAEFSGSKNRSRRALAASALEAMSERMEADEDKIRTLQRMVDAFRDDSERDLRRRASRAVADIARLAGDSSIAVAYYDDVIAGNRDKREVAEIMLDKARVTTDPAEKRRVLDRLISRFGGDGNEIVVRNVARAMQMRAQAEPDADRKAKLYDEIIEKFADTTDSTLARGVLSEAVVEKARLTGDPSQAISLFEARELRAEKDVDIAGALMARAKLVSDPAEKMALYDQVVSRFSQSGDWMTARKAVEALMAKAELVAGRDEKLRLYDAGIALLEGRNGPLIGLELWRAYQAKVGLARTPEDKAAVYDEYLAAGSAGAGPFFAQTMFERAKLYNDPEAKIQSLDEIVARFARDGEQGDVVLAAMLLKAETLADEKAAVAVLDEILASPQPSSRHSMRKLYIVQALELKTRILGDEKIKTEYYDSLIARSDNDAETAEAMLAKTGTLPHGSPGQYDLYRGILTRFSGSRDKTALRAVLVALRNLSVSSLPVEERRALCRSILDKAEEPVHPDREGLVASASLCLAALTDGREEKIRLYGSVIDRFKGSRDRAVVRIVDQAIAEKFRLENDGAYTPRNEGQRFNFAFP